MEPYKLFLTEHFGPNFKAPLFFIAFALVALLLAIRLLAEQARRAGAARRLTQTQGVIRKVEVQEWIAGQKRKALIELEVDFQVDGRAYVCRRYDLYGRNSAYERDAPRPLLHAGEPVAVSYDPKNPKISGLAVGRAHFGPGLIALAAAVVFAALAFVLRG
jgi:hypothetical protein